jgi:SLOG in TRPM, prokaryote
VTSPLQLHFGERQALAVRVTQNSELPAALGTLGLSPPRATVVLVGGAGGLDDAGMARLKPLFTAALVPILDKNGALAIDGGTYSGVMRLLGQARQAQAGRFPLIGVVAAGTVRLPGEPVSAGVDTELDPHHTHFVIVPGDDWGDESPWIAQTATVLAGGAPSITVLVNGGQIAYSDVERSVQAGRAVVVIAGSGRTADALADALAGSGADDRASALAATGQICAVPLEDPQTLAGVLAAALG